MTYKDYLKSLGLRYFSADEIMRLFKYRRRGVQNSEPPIQLWHEITPALFLLDNLRQGLGVPLVLDSTYRSPAYNDAVGGAPRSYHKKNMAIDFHSPRLSPQVLYNRLKAIRDAKGFRGGLAKYPTFVHVDTRGTNVGW
jgi:uncharacterized protein YcbK (DUF882 family)